MIMIRFAITLRHRSFYVSVAVNQIATRESIVSKHGSATNDSLHRSVSQINTYNRSVDHPSARITLHVQLVAQCAFTPDDGYSTSHCLVFVCELCLGSVLISGQGRTTIPALTVYLTYS